MPVLGLVLQMDDASDATRQGVAARLAGQPDVELGESIGHRWPVVVESTTSKGAEARVDALRDLPGVAGVDVVYADFEDLVTRAADGGAPEEA